MNKVTLIGRLTKDPELKYTPGNGTAVLTITLAVDRRFNKDGQKEADFIPIVIWGKSAESTAQYVSKGKLIGIAGRIQIRSYEANDGGRRYVTEVVAEEVKFIEFAKNNSDSNDDMNQDNSDYYTDMKPIDDGDVPF